jgi:hypothetical protein
LPGQHVPGQCLQGAAQAVVGDVAGKLRGARPSFRVDRAGLCRSRRELRLPFGKAGGRGLGQADTRNRGIAVAGVHLLADLLFLHFQHRRVRAGGQDGQRRAEPLTPIVHLHRAGRAGGILADNLGPVGQKAGHGKAALFTHVANTLSQQARSPFEAPHAAGRAFGVGFAAHLACHFLFCALS